MMNALDTARGLGLVCVVLASGCSPYLYKDEIQAFEQRTRALAAAFDEAGTATATDYRHRIGVQQLLNNQQPRVKLSEDCIDLADRAKPVNATVVAGADFECRLVTVVPGTAIETDLEIDPFREHFANADKITRALDAYTKALLAITNADDRKALDAAAQDLCKALGVLGTAAPGGGEAAGAVCRLVTNTYAAYLDRRRYQVLRAGVVEADREVMPGLTVYLEALLQQARNDRIASVAYVADAASRSLGEGRRASRAPDTGDLVYTDRYWVPLNLVFASAKDLEHLLTFDPAAVVRSFAKAHNDLAAAVDSGKGQTDAVSQSLETLSEQIQAMRKAFESAAG